MDDQVSYLHSSKLRVAGSIPAGQANKFKDLCRKLQLICEPAIFHVGRAHWERQFGHPSHQVRMRQLGLEKQEFAGRQVQESDGVNSD
jgi:hypothetical protein